MLLDDLKDLIKDFETVLSKDSRFKEHMDFKNQVKVIYQCDKPVNQIIPSYDITDMISNLSLLNGNNNKTNEIDKLKDRIKYLEILSNKCNCDEYKPTIKDKGSRRDTGAPVKKESYVCNCDEYKLVIKHLIEAVEKASEAGAHIGMNGILSKETIDKISKLIEEGNFDEVKKLLGI